MYLDVYWQSELLVRANQTLIRCTHHFDSNILIEKCSGFLPYYQNQTTKVRSIKPGG